ncbi:MAG: putative baseplate assembly protein [Nitrospirae bacterium]|nr:putative baseplate assembly protein [Nitrospirota bacterium]
MSLPKPELDDLTFEQLVSEARGLIPRYAPRWTDHNISDPGITLIELLAWLTETSLYRLNLVTEKHLRKYLQLLGIAPQPIKPATVELVFESETEIVLDRGLLLQAELEGEKIYFELEHPMKIAPVKLERVVTDEVVGVFDRTDTNNEPELFFAPFGEATLDGACLYLGFGSPSDVINLFIEIYEDDLIPLGSHGDEGFYRFRNAELQWQFSLTDGKWQDITPSFDETDGFKYSGRVVFEKIDGWSSAKLPFFDYSHCWLRCILRRSEFEYPPRIKTIMLNTAKAVHGRTIRTEERFTGTGLPGQVYKLKNRPVLKGSIKLTVDGRPWQERTDLYGSGPGDMHFMLDSKEGAITFGDGLMGAVPPDGAVIVVSQYRTGGGTNGNLPAGLTWTAEGCPGLRISNRCASREGRDEETVEEAKLRLLRDLRTPYRAITSADFEYIAKNTPGLRIARAKAFVKDKTVTVVVVPYTPLETFQRPPEPSRGFLGAICRHIDRHRLIGTPIKVKGPEYIRVQVSMRIRPERGIDEVSLGQTIIQSLNRYLHPVKGWKDGGGWPAGEPVYRSELYRLIEEIEGVRCVVGIHISGNRGAFTDPSGNLLLPTEESVVYSGRHSIVFLRETERCRRSDG